MAPKNPYAGYKVPDGPLPDIPPIVKRLRGQLARKGMPPGQAAAVASSTLQKSGSLKPGTNQLTPKGVSRQDMGAAGRAKDRAAAQSSHDPKDFAYNQLTNRARLK